MMPAAEIIPSSTLWLIPALPFAGFLLAIVFGDARRLITIAAPAAVGAAFAIAVAAVLTLLRAPAGARLVDDVYPWIVAGPFRADVAFRVDALSAVMVLIVTGVGFLIH